MNPGQEFGNWLVAQANGVLLGIIAVFAIGALIKKKVMAAISLFVVVVAVLILMNSGVELGTIIADQIVEWFK